MSPAFLPNAEIESLTRDRFPEFGDEPVDMDVIERSGSGRCFYRMKNRREAPVSIMAMQFTLDREENGRFVDITKFLQSVNIKVPGIRGEMSDPNILWVDDLGNQHLIDCGDRDWNSRQLLYQHTLLAIAALHDIGEKEAPATLPELEKPFDEPLYKWEQDYFFEMFVANFCKKADGEMIESIRHGSQLRELRESLAAEPRSLVHRDFQSTNVMVVRGRTWMIDYQGMRWGVPEYDIASLIYDPYVELSSTQRDELAHFYFEVRQNQENTPKESYETFEKRLNRAAAQRLMQALGAYGNLGLNIGKTEFLQHIPVGLDRLREAAVEREIAPELGEILETVEFAL